MAVVALLLCAGVCVHAHTSTEEPDAFLDYIEATGSQYIDTGVNAETGLKARIDFAWVSEDISGKVRGGVPAECRADRDAGGAADRRHRGRGGWRAGACRGHGGRLRH